MGEFKGPLGPVLESSSPEPPAAVEPSDDALVAEVLGGAAASFEPLMRRHNRRVFRAIRAIVRNADDAEDVMQQAYVQAFANLAQFRGQASFATWLTRIAVHAALASARRHRRETTTGADVDALSSFEPENHVMSIPPAVGDPERGAGALELRAVLEGAIDALPEHYRVVFVLRAVEGLSVHETSESLGVGEETVKTRFFRARNMLQEVLLDRVDAASPGAFDFHLSRCDRVVRGVFESLEQPPPPPRTD